MPRPLQVFLCHASQDKPAIRELYQRLKAEEWIDPWLDEEKITLGQHWTTVIEDALHDADAIIIFLSRNSVRKEGFIQRELNYAWDISLEKPRENIFLIPFRLDDCDIPRYLSSKQWGDYFDEKKENTYQVLLRSLQQRHLQKLQLEAAEKIEYERTKRETKEELVKKEKSENDNKAIVDTIARNVQEFVENGEQERTEDLKPVSVVEAKNIAKPFTRILNPSSLTSQKKLEPKENKQNNNIRALSIGGITIITFLCIFFGGNYLTQTLGSTMISEKDGMVLVYIPAGEFTMGSDEYSSEQPIHQVTLDAFWIDQTEVTNDMYAECVNANQCDLPSNANLFNNSGYANQPVFYVSWNDAIDYCTYVGRRLPTEAEWEKAARSTNGNIYPWGNEEPNIRLVNYNNGIGETTEVGNYPEGESIYGALDMAGNVWEWVNDWYDENYYQTSPSSNPSGPDSGQYKVLRGGSWNDSDGGVRSAFRFRLDPSFTNDNIGFRCSRSP